MLDIGSGYWVNKQPAEQARLPRVSTSIAKAGIGWQMAAAMLPGHLRAAVLRSEAQHPANSIARA